METAAAASSSKGAALDDLLKHLVLRDDEKEDVMIAAEQVKEFKKEARWMAIAKVHTTRSFSAEALFGKMKAIWNLSREPNYREAGENLFIFQMHCLGDWKKVVHQGPWTFRGWAVLIEDYDGCVDPVKVAFGGMYTWAQIHGLPELYRKIPIVDNLSRKIGKTKEVQMSPKMLFEGNYVRLRVLIEVEKPQSRFVFLNIEGEGTKMLFVKYEKLPYFCRHCGLIGHDHEECGDGDWEEKDLQYGTWMLASRRTSVTQPDSRRPIIRERGRDRGRGNRPGRADGTFQSRKRSSQEADLDADEEDGETMTSPLKTTTGAADGMDSDTGVRRNLNFVDKNSSTDDIGGAGQVANAGGQIPGEVPPPPPAYIDPRERAKIRKTGDSKVDTNTVSENQLAPSAASLEEDRRAQ
ncbi:hypothetical protein ACQ4PT_053607 [Festuca glaucescens]